MATMVLALALAQGPQCSPEATALMKAATERAAVFDLAGAVQCMQAAVTSGCAAAMLPALYLCGGSQRVRRIDGRGTVLPARAASDRGSSRWRDNAEPEDPHQAIRYGGRTSELSWQYVQTLDGRQFRFKELGFDEVASPMTMVLNWQELLARAESVSREPALLAFGTSEPSAPLGGRPRG